mmetsp:Transcript_2318/g.6997  ORF Transcript_2318/g.6997 Transcript_2318/m.6997 type:complete len:106 (-) Transcript_2318:6-323(-)
MDASFEFQEVVYAVEKWGLLDGRPESMPPLVVREGLWDDLRAEEWRQDLSIFGLKTRWRVAVEAAEHRRANLEADLDDMVEFIKAARLSIEARAALNEGDNVLLT